MELFVVNRHDDNVEEKDVTENEKANLDKVLKRIQRNKKIRQKQKEKKLLHEQLKERTTLKRLENREKKARMIPVPDTQDELLDENFKEPKHIVEEKPSIHAPIEGFTILGGDKFDKKTKVKRVLPKWLTNPTVISINLQNLETKVSDVKELDKSLRKKLKANGIKYFFPVQAQVIPWLLESNRHSNVIFPRDICVSAPTGSGKTLAFVLPVIQALKQHTVKKIRALVILPTQDLANQVYKAFKTYSRDTNIDVSLITGKSSFQNEQNQLVVKNEAFGYLSKIDILVCTAGRLVDHIKSTKGFCLQSLEFLIIDEADRVLETVQNDWLYHLEKHIYDEESSAMKILNLFALKKRRPPQKLLFSATLSQDPEKLQKLSLFQPKLFTSVIKNENEDEQLNTETFIGKYTTPKELIEKFIVCSLDLKPLVLFEFVKKEQLTKSLVFTHSIESAHRLCILLRSLSGDMKIEEISSNLNTKNRNVLIEQFKEGNINLLICTDSLARGIDLEGVQCVISYSAPKYLKTYIHRAGRTARAGELGLAVTILHKTQLAKFQSLLQQADKNNLEEIKISEEHLEPLVEKYKKALLELKSEVAKEEKSELKKLKAMKGTTKQKRLMNLKRKRNDSLS